MLGHVRNQSFPFIASISLIVKLWLTADITMLALNAGHDASNFLEHAKSIAAGHWFGPYDCLTLIKGPAFPLFIAAVREFGISFALAHQLLYFGASVIACVAIRPIVRNARVLAACFVILFFNPDTFDSQSWVLYRSLIGGSLTLLAFACAAALTIRRSRDARHLWAWSIGLGVSFSAFWLNREENVWLVPALLIALGPYAWQALRELRVRAFERISTLALPVAMWTLSIVAIMAINRHVYGWATVVEVGAPEFVGAYASLARIVHPPADPRIPVPTSALRIAYAVSPAAAELRSTFEGSRGAAWQSASCQAFAVCDGIAGGWFLWAFREAADRAGNYRSGRVARAYYVELSREIDVACDSGRIRCERKRATLAPKITESLVPLLANNFRAGLFELATWRTFAIEPWAVPLAPEAIVADYRFATGAIGIDDRHDTFEGWLVAPNASNVEVLSDGALDASARVAFSASPDVAAAVGRLGFHSGAEFARFRVLGCAERCALRVLEADGRSTDIDLDRKRPDFSRPRILFHLDGDIVPADVAATAPMKRSILIAIAGSYEAVAGPAVLVALILFLHDLCSFALWRLPDRSVICAGMLVSTLSITGILTIVETLSFPGFEPEYFGVVHPLVLLFAATILACRTNPEYPGLLQAGAGPVSR